VVFGALAERCLASRAVPARQARAAD